jgi:ABC-type branched-subunit amino acid transport system ATPase component/MFS family permease
MNAKRRRPPPPDDGLGDIRRAEAAVDLLENRQHSLRLRARQLVGVGDGAADVRNLREDIAAGAGWRLLLALTLFVALDEVAGFVMSVVGPEVSSSLGVSPAVFATIVTQRQTFVGLAAVLFAWLIHRRARRTALSMQQAISEALALVIGSLITWTGAFLPVLGPIGGAGGVVYAAHRPLIMDGYPPEVRVRAMSVHRAGAVVGLIGAPALVSALAGWGDLSWRGVFAVSGMVLFVLALVGVRLKDLDYGRFDTDRVRQMVREVEGSPEAAQPGDDPGLSFIESLRRVWLIPSVRRLLVAWAVLGAVLTPLVTYLFFFLQERFGLTLGARSLFFGAAWVFALPALLWFGRRTEAMFRSGPSDLVQFCARVMLVLALGLLIAVVPVIGISFAGFAAVFACSSMLIPGLSVVLLSIVRPRSRPLAGAMSGFFFAMVGAEAGALLLGGIDQRFSTGVAIACLAVPAVVTSVLLRGAARGVEDDLDHMLDEVIEQEELATFAARGVHLPLLACRHIDFSYGDLQVLFDVNFTVDDGEMVALLGTNGAGKSTLLRVISGLGYPSRGSVVFQGREITYLDADRRVPMGITQVPGGRSVFGPLSVVDNLRAFAHSHGRDRTSAEQGIEAAFAALPHLAARPDQLASTLSGGEQQMLGLAKAFILRPRILLIDELSLGLAPKVVGELLEIVRRINAAGAAVVLVEQSANIALALVDHAYFMEKGTIRFDGPATELLDRPDLLRSIFLEGLTRGGTA